MKSNYKNFVHIISLYTYCSMTHGAYNVKLMCSQFVSSMFWGLYMIDRELVFPRAMDVIMPSWTNHSTHTIIIVALVVEMRIARHRYSKRSLGLATLALYLTIYDLL